jgi:DNA-binding NarL/FixJ family response regulator
MAIRTLLADDHTILRQGLRRILESHRDITVVAEASTGLQAVDLAREHLPDVAVLDIGMKELNGIEAAAQITRHSRKTAVLILSMHDDENYVLKAVQAGARGYLLKDSVEEEIILAIQHLHAGKSFFSPAIARILFDSSGEPQAIDERYHSLTERERQIYQLLGEGKSNRDVAGRLGLSLHTVETHRTRIMQKLEVHSGAELVLSAVRRGLVF